MSQNNQRQKGLSYLSLARIHYDSLKQYELAKSYYDSTVSTLPKDEENYAAIKIRQEILEEFVKHILIVRTNDSLLALSELSDAQKQAWAMRTVSKDSTQAANDKITKEKQQKAQERQVTLDKNQGNLISTSGDVTWYFANPTSVSRGYTAFQRKWKDRPLEDNWRRSLKIVTTFENKQQEQIANNDGTREEETAPEVSTNEKISALLASIPTTEEAKTKLLTEIMDALYAIGNIYNFKLDEKQNAIETFEDLLARFPGCVYEAEVLYQLYLLNQESNPPASQQAAQRLLSDHPESIYAKLVQNPNYREETFAATMQMQAVYKRAYAKYKINAYEESLMLLDSAVRTLPVNEFSDNVQLLRILNIGQLEGQYKYQFELDNFVKLFSESELIPYVQTLIKSSDEYKANLFSASRAKYIPYFDQTHYLILIYPVSDANSKAASALFEDFIKKYDPSLKFGNLLMSDEHSVAVINNLPDKAGAQQAFTNFSAHLSGSDALKGVRYFAYIITEDNFGILYQTKDIDSYKTFFEKNYK
jgi:tetratricopeptide (TPR) repeat protein